MSTPSNWGSDLVPVATPVYRLPAGITTRDVAAVLFRRQRIIVAVLVSALATLGLGAVWLRPWLNPPRYTAGLKFLLKKDRFDAVVTPSDRSVPGINTIVSPQEILSEIELLKGSDVLDRLARESGAGRERLSRDLVAEPVAAGRNLTNLIAVRYTARDPAEVSRVLDRLPEVYLDKYLSVNRQPGALEYFRGQAETCGQQLEEAEQELAEFQKQLPQLAAEGRREAALARVGELEKLRVEADAAVREAESRLVELARQLGALPATITRSRVMEEPASLARLKAQLADLENKRAQVTWKPELSRLEERIAATRRVVESHSQAAPGRVEESLPHPMRQPVETELLRSQALLAGLRARRAALAEQERTGREQLAAARLIAAENGVQLAQLTRAVKTAEENDHFYRKKYAEAREAESLDQKRVLNVSVAERPGRPAPAPAGRTEYYLLIGSLLAISGALGAAFLVEMLDHSVHTPRELELCSAVTVLAAIPENRRG